jgi:hypothetical protein
VLSQDLEMASPCHQPGRVSGPCRSQKPRYYYDNVTSTCRIFFYGGCGGNSNNFDNVHDCTEMCNVDRVKQMNRLKICEQPQQVKKSNRFQTLVLKGRLHGEQSQHCR